MDFLNITQESQQKFKEIAETLFNAYAIKTHDTLYRITEVEFYWYSDSHKDHSTYKRKHVFPNAGQWFFHYSGVDIALKNDTGGYGGILIRGLHDGEHFVNGPMVCAMKLFSCTDAFSPTIQTHIVRHHFHKLDAVPLQRVGLGKNAVDSGTDQFLYRFQIKPVNGKRYGD
ncbi:hypothetical protein ACFQZS_14170 [Mucilaginibacter calamicampi]|uniref:Uncharacterized protein n=1 Tax=Mucilaginibacter calamicampi TaxID=1302352 RepID=A0ABW2YY40_9SPHI